MMPFSENGVTVNFPDTKYFQFGSCHAYRILTPFHVKEMDICWLDVQSNTLWAVELKAFDHPANPRFVGQNLNDPSIVSYWIDELYKKSVHTLCMLETNRSGTSACIIPGITVATTFRLVYLINVQIQHEPFLIFINDELNLRLKPYKAIFNVTSITVISYAQAKNGALLPWII